MSKAKGKDHKGFRRATLVTAGLAAVMACGPQGWEEEKALGKGEHGTAQQAVTTCSTKTTINGYVTWAHFMNPTAPCKPDANGFDRNITDEFIRLVQSVPAGGTIRGNISSISSDAVARELLAAQNRGVKVYITGSGQLASQTGGEMTYLNQLTNKKWCYSSVGPTYGCIGNTADGAAHTKAFTFSSVTLPDAPTQLVSNVTWFGSMNFTYLNWSQNAVTVYGDTVLYDGMTKILSDMYTGVYRGTNYYDSSIPRGYVNAASANIYASPEQEYDIIVSRINDVTPDAYCRVRVLQASVKDSRLEVVDQLVKLKQGGCRVEVAAETVEPTALGRLKGAGIPVRQYNVHDKVFIIYGKYGTVYQYKVYTGSHNLSGHANDARDEIFVAMTDNRALHDAFYFHWLDAYNNGTPL
jgi:phosphatidylserine/phosphatidylglycerophosphate/cardiolipin synthase-like enzyme